MNIECPECGDTVPGENRAEAVEDARNIGWGYVRGRLLCGDCIEDGENP